ncbi:ABC transporter permease [Nonomuraea soli]|uniref:Peptide/nickel transport system permease protein n=1 Tax=Nonomuraea soli TaxID=1032476 RepID=A0A7W0HN72_9ACTN|nr:ABC transporter permease [Nonomuraea soli]MBA2889477.1 peptide/nickel transport system permease protein [Nonomuraea soli]
MKTVVVRLAGGVGVMWAAATASWLALLVAPGDVTSILLGDGADTPEIRAAIAREWGLDQPQIVQYLSYLARLLQGDLGRSYTLQQGVGDLLAGQLGPTVELMLAATATGIVLALLLAVATAGRGRWLRGAVSGVQLAWVSVPPFLVGILLLFVFSFTLGWFPVSGARDTSALVLPALTLGLPIAGSLGQVLREGLERAQEQPFAVTARARGLTESALVVRHTLRHASLPAVTLAGMLTGSLLGGAIITESLYGRPGLGQLTLTAVTSQDLPVMMAIVILAAALYVLISTVLDLLYRIIDPRLRSA